MLSGQEVILGSTHGGDTLYIVVTVVRSTKRPRHYLLGVHKTFDQQQLRRGAVHVVRRLRPRRFALVRTRVHHRVVFAAAARVVGQRKPAQTT